MSDEAGRSLGGEQLFEAAGKGDVGRVRRCLDQGTVVDWVDPLFGATSLGQAADYGRLEVVTLLLAAQADPNHADSEGKTPLMGACENGHAQVAHLLLEARAELGFRDHYSKSARDLAAARQHKHVLDVLHDDDDAHNIQQDGLDDVEGQCDSHNSSSRCCSRSSRSDAHPRTARDCSAASAAQSHPQPSSPICSTMSTSSTIAASPSITVSARSCSADLPPIPMLTQQTQNENAPTADRSMSSTITGTVTISLSPAPISSHISTEDITTRYQLGAEVGEPGGFGRTVGAIDMCDQTAVAIKLIPRHRISQRDFNQEVEVMEQVRHPSIVKFVAAYQDRRYFYIVMELCSGGELFEHIKAKGGFSESDARKVFKQLCEGVHFLHNMNIAHCDIKPENLLFSSADPANARLKLIDFGMANRVALRKYLSHSSGTVAYIAPEQILGKYTKHCDIWSMGIVLFVLLFGFTPFYNHRKNKARSDAEMRRAILKGFTPMRKAGHGPWFPEDGPRLSNEVYDLLEKCLYADPSKRITTAEILKHPWLTDKHISSTPIKSVMAFLETYHQENMLKRQMLQALNASDYLSDLDLLELEKVFKSLDRNGDGVITAQELKVALLTCSPTPTPCTGFTPSHPAGHYFRFPEGPLSAHQDATASSGEQHASDDSLPNDPPVLLTQHSQELVTQLQSLLNLVQSQSCSGLVFHDLILAAVRARIVRKEERLWKLFCSLDLDQDGFVSTAELTQALQVPPEQAKDMIAEVDKNGDGQVDYSEFLSMWTQRKAEDLFALANPFTEQPAHPASVLMSSVLSAPFRRRIKLTGGDKGAQMS